MENRLGSPCDTSVKASVGKTKSIVLEKPQSVYRIQSEKNDSSFPTDLGFRDAVLHWWDTHAGYLRRGSEPTNWD